jgi:hypothetical protein
MNEITVIGFIITCISFLLTIYVVYKVSRIKNFLHGSEECLNTKNEIESICSYLALKIPCTGSPEDMEQLANLKSNAKIVRAFGGFSKNTKSVASELLKQIKTDEARHIFHGIFIIEKHVKFANLCV